MEFFLQVSFKISVMLNLEQASHEILLSTQCDLCILLCQKVTDFFFEFNTYYSFVIILLENISRF